MKKRITSLFLSIAIVFSVFVQFAPFVWANEVTLNDNIRENPDYYVGHTATFSAEYSSFHITDNPEEYDFAYWEDDAYWIYNEALGTDDIPDDNVELVITNGYYDAENGMFWYSVEAAPGHRLPEKLIDKPYILYMEEIYYPEEELADGTILPAEWEEWIYLDIAESGKNYIFDENGSQIDSDITMDYYDVISESIWLPFSSKI